ncbi:hypothetical protein EVAR_5934_1 [Eumeta japonica]|uniref:Uncharacterized protein n=1 Tax=Eumeta variegata TaxID=151549 RepID=A0A4C1TFN6_EUMVA|nr:hypothetical protein EVAR_5934_1 [Eumeta japonica]
MSIEDIEDASYQVDQKRAGPRPQHTGITKYYRSTALGRGLVPRKQGLWNGGRWIIDRDCLAESYAATALAQARFARIEAEVLSDEDEEEDRFVNKFKYAEDWLNKIERAAPLVVHLEVTHLVARSAATLVTLENTTRLRQSLKGVARETINEQFCGGADSNIILELLERRCGRPDIFVTAKIEKLRKVLKCSENPSAICAFSTTVSNVVSTIKDLKKAHMLIRRSQNGERSTKENDSEGVSHPGKKLSVAYVTVTILCDVSVKIRGLQEEDEYVMSARIFGNLKLSPQTVEKSTLDACHHLSDIVDQLEYKNATLTLLIGQDNWALKVSNEVRTGPRHLPTAPRTNLV